MGFTDLQKRAIEARGGNLIVSASAGSGKTTVMIERVLSLLAEGESLENMVICTFTRAAASDMRDKLQNALMKAADRGEPYAEAQILLLPLAEISTLHSWCQRLIKTYFYELDDIDPSFEIADETDAAVMLSAAVDDAVEEAIARGDADFALFYDVMLSRRGDEALKNLIKTVYNYAVTQSEPEQWLEKGAYVGYDSPELCDAVMIEEKKRLTARFLPLAEKLLSDTVCAGFTRNIPAVEALTAEIKGESFDRVSPRGKIPPEFTELNDRLIRLKKAYGVAAENVYGYYELPSPDAPPIFTRTLIDLVRSSQRKYAELKRKKSRLDYSDLEHLACRLVENPAIRADIVSRFRYIFVDEFQDVNPLQERIIDGVKNNNLFLVGDVKQSIYAFRMCDPGIFLDKYLHWKENDFARPIELNDNFRSAVEILDFTNEVFCPLMTEDFGKLDYSGNARLTSGRGIAGGEVGLKLIVRKEKEFPYKGIYSVLDCNDENVGPIEAETNLIVADIVQKLSYGTVTDGNGRRPVGYSDIAVLVSARGEHVKLLYSKLKKLNIPVSLSDGMRFSSVHEIAVLIEFMKYICDFTDDIALVSVLRSALVGISDDCLSDIRLYGGREEKRFGALCRKYAAVKKDETAEKLNGFFALADRYLSLSYTRTAGELVGALVAEKEWFAHTLSLPDADVKADALSAFLDRLCSSPYGGSVREYVEYLKLGGDDFKRPPDANAVSIMTVHAAKGLEFPFVYLAGADRQFNLRDLTGKVILDGELGLCMKNHDFTARVVVPNKLTCAASFRLRRNRLEEQMRLLYVALTRAVYGLYIYACADEDDELLSGAVDTADFEGGRSFFDWLRPVYASRGFDAVREDECLAANAVSRRTIAGKIDPSLISELTQYMDYKYPHGHCEVKSSVTAINAHSLEEESPTYFIAGGDDDRAVKRGNAYHKIMELIDFSVDFDSAWEKLKTFHGITEEVDYGEIRNAWHNIGALVSGKRFYREKQFIYNTGARLIQGVIDLMVISDGKCTIVDYKTAKKETIQSGAYDVQLAVYAAAAEDILGVKADRVCVYSFPHGDFIDVSPQKISEIKNNPALKSHV